MSVYETPLLRINNTFVGDSENSIDLLENNSDELILSKQHKSKRHHPKSDDDTRSIDLSNYNRLVFVDPIQKCLGDGTLSNPFNNIKLAQNYSYIALKDGDRYIIKTKKKQEAIISGVAFPLLVYVEDNINFVGCGFGKGIWVHGTAQVNLNNCFFADACMVNNKAKANLISCNLEGKRELLIARQQGEIKVHSCTLEGTNLESILVAEDPDSTITCSNTLIKLTVPSKSSLLNREVKLTEGAGTVNMLLSTLINNSVEVKHQANKGEVSLMATGRVGPNIINLNRFI